MLHATVLQLCFHFNVQDAPKAVYGRSQAKLKKSWHGPNGPRPKQVPWWAPLCNPPASSASHSPRFEAHLSKKMIADMIAQDKANEKARQEKRVERERDKEKRREEEQKRAKEAEKKKDQERQDAPHTRGRARRYGQRYDGGATFVQF